jgi:hypothetical protein
MYKAGIDLAYAAGRIVDIAERVYKALNVATSLSMSLLQAMIERSLRSCRCPLRREERCVCGLLGGD